MNLKDYLNEIQDFDDASQRELLADFQNRNFLDFSEVMQQSTRSFQDFLNTGNSMPQPIRLGETIRGMSHVSPLVTMKPADNSQSADFLKKTYFVDAQNEKKGNLNIINDLKKTAKDGYLYTSLDVFFDKNLNGVRDPDEKLLFTVYFFFSDDGNKVREAYKTARLGENDIYFFIEGDEDFFSSKKLYAKVSPSVKKQFYNKEGELDERFFNPSTMRTLAKETGLEINIIRELLEKGNLEKDNVNIENLLNVLKQGFLSFFAISKATGWICNKIGNGLDELKISDDFWDTQSEDYFFDKDNLLEKITISDDLVNDIDKLFADRRGLDLHDLTPNILENYIKKYSGAIKEFIRYYNDFITKEIESIYKLADTGLVEFLAGKMQLWVAYHCGLWNGLVDFISSLFKFIGSILEAPFNAAQDFQGAMETLDTICDFLFGGNFWENLGTSVSEMYHKMLDFCKTHNKEDFDWVRVAYIAGSGVAFIGSFFIPFTQVLKVAKLGKIAEIVEAVNKEVGAVISAAAKYGKDQAYRALSALLELFSKGGNGLKKFLQQVWNELQKWFLKARYKLSKAKEFLGLGFSRETAETLGNLGLKPKIDGFRQKTLNAGIYGNFVTRLEYKGFMVFRGDKKQVKALAEKLKNMGDEAAVKYLDDLLEKVFLISKKFEEHIVQGHVKIEIVNAQLPKKILINGIEQNNPSRILEEYEYLLGKGRAKTTIKPPYQAKIKSKGGMHVLDNFNKKLIQIYEHVSVEFLPTGEKVLISKIKYWVEELGDFVTKKDKHTFFPKEWDISKIKKVVQEASENITFRQGNKYRGITKQGIEIEFYIDAKSREITTAFIYFK